jgi:lysophospholipase L1-like esterase
MVVLEGATMLNMSLAHDFGGQPQFRTFVNGTLHLPNVSIFDQELTTYRLATGLNPSVRNIITIWYITDPITLDWPRLQNKSIHLKSLSTDGKFASAPQTRARRLQIIGDSVTAGNQIAGNLPDHSGTFGAKLCEYFEANCTTLAISGKGIYRNSMAPAAEETMDLLYKRIIVGDPVHTFDDSAFVPDAVVVNLGTNDAFCAPSDNMDCGEGHGASGGFEASSQWIGTFAARYADFLVNLTRVHRNPSLPIFVGVGPFKPTREPKNNYGAWVPIAVALARERGVSSIHMLDFLNCSQDGSGGHPGWVGHHEMFEIAKPMLRKVLGWDGETQSKTLHTNNRSEVDVLV